MRRRRTTDAPADGPATATAEAETHDGDRLPASDTNGNAEPLPDSNGKADDHAAPAEKRKPLISWRISSDARTSIELSVWGNTYRNQQTNEEYEQLSCTLTRSYKDAAGAWQKGGGWRIHDLRCVAWLLTKGEAFAFERRVTTSDGTCPF